MRTLKSLGKKAEGEITGLLIAVLVVGMFTTSLVVFGEEVDQTYNTGFDDSEFNSFNRIADIQQNLSLVAGVNMEEGSGEISSQGDTIEGQARAAFESFKILLKTPGIFIDMLIDAFRISNNSIKINPVFMFGFMAIVTLIVVTSGIALFFKLKP